MRKATKAVSLLLTLCLLAGVLSGCDSYDNFKAAFFEPEQAEVPVVKTVRLGVFEPLTGEEAEKAKDEIAGIELAHDLFPTVLGQPVELVYADNQSTVEGSVAAAETLVEENVSAVLGSWSSVLSMAGGDVFKAAETPAIAATCANPILTKTNDYYFRTCVVNDYQGRAAAYYVNKYLLQSTAAVLLRNGDEQAEAMSDQFIATMNALTNSESSVTKIYLPNENVDDYSVYLKLLAMTEQKAVFFPCGQTLGKTILYQESLDPDMDFSWVGTVQWDGIDAPVEGEPDPASYLHDVSYIINYDADAIITDMSITLSDAYKQKYGEDAVPSEAVALGFDAYRLALDAISRAEDSEKGWYLATMLRATSGFQGATGSITINAYGDPSKDMSFERYMGGEFGSVYTAPPITE